MLFASGHVFIVPERFSADKLFEIAFCSPYKNQLTQSQEMVDTATNFLSFLAFIWLPVSIYLTACSPPFHLFGYSCDIEFLNKRKAPLFSERSMRSMTF